MKIRDALRIKATCLLLGHDRYVVPLWKLGICKRCGNGS